MNACPNCGGFFAIHEQTRCPSCGHIPPAPPAPPAERPTPEADAATWDANDREDPGNPHPCMVVDAAVARKLERERDEGREVLHELREVAEMNLQNIRSLMKDKKAKFDLIAELRSEIERLKFNHNP